MKFDLQNKNYNIIYSIPKQIFNYYFWVWTFNLILLHKKIIDMYGLFIIKIGLKKLCLDKDFLIFYLFWDKDNTVKGFFL